MRIGLAVTLALGLAACSGAATKSAEAGSKEAAGASKDAASKTEASTSKASTSKASTGEASESDSPFAPGAYQIVVADGPDGEPPETINLVLKPDETFEISEGRNKQTGVFAIEDAAVGSKACFKEAKESEQTIICITAGERKADGTWAVTNDGGEPATMKRIGK